MQVDPNRLAAVIIVIFFAIGLHEYAHCKVADMAGDPTPSIYGRVTLNLTKHFEPVGTFMILITSLSGFGIGWGKPAPIDPRKMGNPRWDCFAAVLAGPLSNLIQAIVYAVLLRLYLAQGNIDVQGLQTTFLGMLLLMGILINLSLCFFNLIPLGPLDGHWLLGLLLPEKPRHYWFRFSRGPGTLLLIVLVIGSQAMSRAGGLDLIGLAVEKPVIAVFRLLIGHPPSS